jgi:hypothetical protein
MPATRPTRECILFLLILSPQYENCCWHIGLKDQL